MGYDSRVHGVVVPKPGKFQDLLKALAADGFRWDDDDPELYVESRDLFENPVRRWTGVAVGDGRLEGLGDWNPAHAFGRLIQALRRPEVTALLQEVSLTREGEENGDLEEWSYHHGVRQRPGAWYHQGVWYTDVEVGRATVPADVADLSLIHI